MRLSFQNIGKVAKSDIEVDSIQTKISVLNPTGYEKLINLLNESEVPVCTQ